MSTLPGSTLQQRTPFSPGVVGLAVSNPPYQVHLVRVYANPRKMVVAGGYGRVILSALIQNIGLAPLNVRARFQAVAPNRQTFAGGSQVALLRPQSAAEFSSQLSLPPYGPFYAVAAADYNVRGRWFTDPDQGMTDVEVYPSGNVSPPYARDENGAAVSGAIIDYRDFPNQAWWPH